VCVCVCAVPTYQVIGQRHALELLQQPPLLDNVRHCSATARRGREEEEPKPEVRTLSRGVGGCKGLLAASAAQHVTGRESVGHEGKKKKRPEENFFLTFSLPPTSFANALVSHGLSSTDNPKACASCSTSSCLKCLGPFCFGFSFLCQPARASSLHTAFNISARAFEQAERVPVPS
jgi:hypothetical protein